MSHEILVVEDSTTQAESLRLLLHQHGFSVTIAHSAEDAMAVLDVRDFDLVLSDIIMPGADGYALTRHVKQDLQRQELMVILLTTLSDPLDIVRGLASGADNYVTKPYEPEVLLARVRQVLAARDRRRGRTRKASVGVQVECFGVEFMITSEKEQILDLLLSSVEDTVRANHALQESQRQLAEAHEQLLEYADRMRRQAHASTARYETLVQDVWDGIFVVDREGRIVETNARAAVLVEELTGSPARAGTPLVGLAAPDQRARLANALAELPAVGHVELYELSLGGRGRTVFCDLALALAPGDDQQLVLAIAHDITERHESERRLRESDERARTILDSLSEGVLMVAANGTVEWCNRTATDFLGAPLERVIGRSATELGVQLLDENEEPLALREYPVSVARRAGSATPRLVGLSMEGRPTRWMLASAQALARRDEQPPYPTVLSIVDFSERKRVQEQLLQAQRLEAVGRLAGGVAHDFNNILTVIRSYCDVALDEVAPATQLSADLKEISKAADRATMLTQQLLTVGRRKLALPQPLSLNRVVSEMESILRRLIREDTELSLSLDPALPSIVADPSQVEQVLMNLVVNARDAMPTGGRLTVATRAVRSDLPHVTLPGGLAPGSYAVLDVSDTGIGMSAEVRDRIFEPFFTTKAQGTGTGLGLATVYGIVTASGGHVAVRSEPGAGTTFEVYFRCTDLSPAQASREAEDVPDSGSGETILLAEAEESVRRVVSQELQRLGYQVLETGSGRDALAAASRSHGPIDLVIADTVMPGMSGHELVRAVRRVHPESRVLYMAGYSGEPLSDDARGEPGCNFLEKPFSIRDVARRVRAILDAAVPSNPASPTELR